MNLNDVEREKHASSLSMRKAAPEVQDIRKRPPVDVGKQCMHGRMQSAINGEVLLTLC
jgi:hypothetical protein